MMPNITRGPDMAGLMVYLVGPGKFNEHRDPHLVAGDSAIMAWRDDSELSRVDALDIAAQLDQPRQVYGTEVWVPNYKVDENNDYVLDDQGRKIKDGQNPLRDGNVWHCSLSLNPGEGPLSDEQWAAIATDFMDEMGFTDAGGRSPARWVAVRHGLSKKGNDHIHIAASCVREDGTRVNTWNDRNRSQKLSTELEHKYGLQVLHDRGKSPSVPGHKPAEIARAERRGDNEPERDTLRRIARACAVASKTEAEYVRRLRREGLVVSGRFASDRADVVTGYKIGFRPRRVRGKWDPVITYGGGELAPELSLPALRESCGWVRTPESAREAVDEWTAAKRGRPIVHDGGRETRALTDPQLVHRAAKDLAAWNKYLRSIPYEDRAQWANAAGRTAGVLSAWAQRVDPKIGRSLAAAALAAERSAQVFPNQRWHKPAGRLDFAAGAALILFQTTNISRSTGYVLLLQQALKTIEALRDAQLARGELRRAFELERAARVDLAAVHAQLKPGTQPVAEKAIETAPLDPELARIRAAIDAQRGRPAAEAVSREPGPPIPNKLEPQQRPVAPQPQPQRDDGLER